VQLASWESYDLFYESGSTRKSLWGPEETIHQHLLVIMAKYVRAQPPIHFIHPKKFVRVLSTPNSFISLEGHFRSIYLEEITKIEPILILELILIYFDGLTMVNIGWSCSY